MTGKNYVEEITKHEEPLKTFQFINSNSNQKLDEVDRFKVRTQVMKNFYEKKRPANDGNDAFLAPVLGQRSIRCPIKQRIKRFRLLPRGLQDLQALSSSRRSGELVEEHRPQLPVPGSHQDSYIPEMIDSMYPSVGGMNQNQISENETEHQDWQSLEPSWDTDRTATKEIAWTSIREDTSSSQRRRSRGKGKRMTISQIRDSALDLSAGNLNPMAVLPDGGPPRTRILVHHYFMDRMRISSLMMSARKSWLAIGSQDEAFYNAVLSHYAGTYSLTTGKGDPMESLLHRMKSIDIVNSRLGDPELGVSDGTIGAVGTLITYEGNNGSSSALQTHMNGLERMINLRGGFQNAKFPAPLQRLIAWAELTTSSVLSTDPRILKFESPGLQLPPYKCTAAPEGPIMPRIQCPSYDIAWGVIDKDISSVFAELRHLNFILESKDPREIELADTMWNSDKTYLVQRNLVYLSLHPQSEDAVLDTACCLAASLFVDCCFRDLGFHAGVIGRLVSKLKAVSEPLSSLQGAVDDETDEYATLTKLLWVFAFGGIAAVGRPERAWFVEQLAHVCSASEVNTWEDMEDCLSTILWNRCWEVPRGSLWKDIVEARAV